MTTSTHATRSPIKTYLLAFSAAGMFFASQSHLDAQTIASDVAANYVTWADGSNAGTGFGAWELFQSGSGGSYLGTTGAGASTFGLFSADTGVSSAFRPFSSPMTAGQVFSFDFGHTVTIANGGEVGFSVWSNGIAAITWKFVGGAPAWEMNDGGSDFGAGQAYLANTPISFTFTYEGGNDYSYTFGTGSGVGFTANNSLAGGIEGISVFTINQGAGENVGFNNLQVVPEPSAYAALLALAALGFAVARRRR